MATTKKTPSRRKPKTTALEAVPEPTTSGALQVPQVTSMIERALVNPDVSVEKMERLFAFQKQVMDVQAKMDFDAAMARFQQLKETVAHNRKGVLPGNADFTYADYPQMVKTVTPWMKEAQLSHTHKQHDYVIDEATKRIVSIMVDTVISHVHGHSETFTYIAIPDYTLAGKQAVNQIVQRAITYAKRQGLAEALGLATAEDSADHDSVAHVELVSDEKAADIQALLDESGANKEKFFAWCQSQFKVPVASVSDIPKVAERDVVAQLEAARKRRK